MKEVQLFIDGQFCPSSNQKTFETHDPSTGEVLAKVHLPSSADLEKAVNAAHKALSNPKWSTLSPTDRAGLLLAISEKIKEKKDQFIEIEMKDSGSVLRKAKADIHNTISYFKVLSSTVKDLELEVQDPKASREGFSKNFRSYMPVGVCAQIIPWNFPLVMAAWKIGPVLASGSTCVLKSAQETPMSAALLAQVIQEVGIPAGVVNIVTGGANEGDFLVSHPKVNKVAFTGSTAVGKEILKKASESVKRTTLELGGKSANIVLEDADLSIAVDGALYAFLYHQGQACDSGTRLLLHRSIYKEFVDKLLARIKDVRIGLTNDPASAFGPVINEKQYKRIMGFIETSKKEGAHLLYGGERIADTPFDKGYFITPTLFEIGPNHTIWQEEIFGPVLGITAFSTEEEAIRLANFSRYALAAAVWSKDHHRAIKVARQLEAGTVWINEYHLLNPGMPFGGPKESGLGREMGHEGLMSYFEVKHIWESDCDERAKKVWFDALF